MGMRKDTVRKLALALPEAIELETWGQPTFRVRKRIFVMFSDGDREAWVKSTHDEQRALVQMDPETFFVPPYVGPSGWVGVWLDGRADWAELGQLLRDAYRLVAPKRLLRALDDA